MSKPDLHSVHSATSVSDRTSEPSPRVALLVHGMARAPTSMLFLAARLRKYGIRSHLFGYIAALESYDRIVARLTARLATFGAQPYLVVGHSLGGLLLRSAMAALPAGSRLPDHLYCLGTPSRSPTLARRLGGLLPYRILNGDSGAMLSIADRIDRIPRPLVPTTLVAGTSGARGRWSPFGQAENDWIVSVEEVALEGFPLIKLPLSHSFMMNNRRVVDLIVGGGGSAES